MGYPIRCARSLMKSAVKRLFPSFGCEAHLLYLLEKMRRAQKRGWKRAANIVRNRILIKHACDISESAQIGSGLRLPHPVGIVIGEGTQIGKCVTIYHQVTIGRKRKDVAEYPIIGDYAVIYCGALIVGKIKIGDHSIVQAHSVVDQDVPACSIYCANGAIKPVRR